jgi:hypothetical protein
VLLAGGDVLVGALLVEGGHGGKTVDGLNYMRF